MNYEDFITCEWPHCVEKAKHDIHYENDHIHVCHAHQPAVVVNIQSSGRLRVFQHEGKGKDGEQVLRPNSKKPITKREAHEKEMGNYDLDQEAAKKAEAVAVPIEIPKLVQPKKR